MAVVTTVVDTTAADITAEATTADAATGTDITVAEVDGDIMAAITDTAAGAAEMVDTVEVAATAAHTPVADMAVGTTKLAQANHDKGRVLNPAFSLGNLKFHHHSPGSIVHSPQTFSCPG